MTETQCLGGSTIHSLVTFLKTKITSDYQVGKEGGINMKLQPFIDAQLFKFVELFVVVYFV